MTRIQSFEHQTCLPILWEVMGGSSKINLAPKKSANYLMRQGDAAGLREELARARSGSHQYLNPKNPKGELESPHSNSWLLHVFPLVLEDGSIRMHTIEYER